MYELYAMNDYGVEFFVAEVSRKNLSDAFEIIRGDNLIPVVKRISSDTSTIYRNALAFYL